MLIVSILLAISLAFTVYPYLGPPPNTAGTRFAYFTRVKHASAAYEGKNFTWSLTVYNKNCTREGEEKASFYFNFYLDGDLWWSEYDNTDYRIWQCKKESSVTRSFLTSSWYSVKPTTHDLKIELYWYDRNVSQLQDVASFTVPVAVHVERDDLMVYSNAIVYVAIMLVLGFYMLTTGILKISQPPQDPAPVSYSQSRTIIGSLSNTFRQGFLGFYLFILASWQTINTLFYALSLPEQLLPSIYSIVQVAYLIMLFLLIGREGSSLGGYGFSWPDETKRYISVSLFLAVLYCLVTTFVPGVFAGYDVFPSLSTTETFLLVLGALVSSLASEIIFRGYVQSKLTKLSGFPNALLTTSVMFTLYKLPFLPLNLSNIFIESLSLFVLSIFLGFLYYRTKTLWCPIAFYFAISFLKPLTSIESATSAYSILLLEFASLALSSVLLVVLTGKEEQDIVDQENMCARALS